MQAGQPGLYPRAGPSRAGRSVADPGPNSARAEFARAPLLGTARSSTSELLVLEVVRPLGAARGMDDRLIHAVAVCRWHHEKVERETEYNRVLGHSNRRRYGSRMDHGTALPRANA